MDPDRNICLCFHVSQRKVVNYLRREKPKVASQLSECLGAGTGCGWCRPTLEKLWEQLDKGQEPELDVSPEDYAEQRRQYRKTGRRSHGSNESSGK
ncbi:MAG: (2Fe-2S)-binding protein [Phycisphaerales bacterium]|nr:(2Fe-2S)-binding protein [Phycisphaerales bacterium]